MTTQAPSCARLKPIPACHSCMLPTCITCTAVAKQPLLLVQTYLKEAVSTCVPLPPCLHCCTADEVLIPHCSDLLKSLGTANANAPAATLGGAYSALPASSSLMDQCLVEQRYVRGAQLRTLIYNQVSPFNGGSSVSDTPISVSC